MKSRQIVRNFIANPQQNIYFKHMLDVFFKKFFRVKTYLFVILLLSLALITVQKSIYAQRLESDSYIIQFGNFNVTSGQKDSTSYSLTDTVGQVAAGPYGAYGSSNYFVGAGFQYIYQIQDFRFTISKIAIDLGLLTPGIHNTDSHTLTISTRGAGGYTVYAYQLHPLRLLQGIAFIPNTTCDNNDCIISSATTWTNQNIAGFGYSMSGDDIPSDFVNSSYFRPFADFSLAENMQPVMSSANIAFNRQSTITYKAGIDGDQEAGIYETGVVFIAVPGY